MSVSSRMRVVLLLLMSAFLSLRMLNAASVTEKEILSRLQPGHPRLLARADDFAKLRNGVKDSPKVAAWAVSILKQADGLLAAKPSEYEIPDGKRLLATSRRVLDRVTMLGLAFQLSREAKYRDRLWKELEAAAAFKDWNPKHFLDTAEMTAAFALGYDWLYSEWTPQQRAALKRAIVEMGLKQSLSIYRKNTWWAACEHNWNQVCNGGMSMGALAVADEEPALAGEILAAAIKSLPLAMKHFAPDGAWGEGPAYWGYATQYNVMMLASLETALGTDFGLSKLPGFDKAGDFPIHVTGPTGRSFNYADAGEGRPGGSQMFWMASRFGEPSHAAWRLSELRSPSALDFVWGARWLDKAPSLKSLPNARHFRAAQVVTMRSGWDNPNAIFVALKGGDNTVNHGHLDLGSFVLDAGGERWAMDIGADDYNLPGYFGAGRWQFYRCRAEGHNTLVLNPSEAPDQSPRAKAPISRFETGKRGSFAIVDVSEAYAPTATSVRRGIAISGDIVTVQDEISSSKPAELWWFMHTQAAILCKGDTATMTMNGRTLHARIVSPGGASFRELPAEPLPSSPKLSRQQVKGTGSHHGSKGIRKLAIHLEGVTTKTVAVQLSMNPSAPEPVKPLKDW